MKTILKDLFCIFLLFAMIICAMIAVAGNFPIFSRTFWQAGCICSAILLGAQLRDDQ